MGDTKQICVRDKGCIAGTDIKHATTIAAKPPFRILHSNSATLPEPPNLSRITSSHSKFHQIDINLLMDGHESNVLPLY